MGARDFGDDVARVLADASAFMAKHDHKRAADLTNQAIGDMGHVPKIVLMHFNALRWMGCAKDAVEFAKGSPDRLSTGILLLPLVQVLLLQDAVEDAQALISRADDGTRSDTPFLQARIALLAHIEGPGSALELANDLCERFPGRPPLLLENIQIRQKLDHPADVLRWFRDNAPDQLSPPLRRVEASLLAAVGDIEGAESRLRALLDEGYRAHQVHIALIAALQSACRLEDAIDACMVALKENPHNCEINARHWGLLRSLGRQDAALEACQAFENAAPNTPQVKLTVSRYLASAKRIEEATALLERDEAGLSGTLAYALARADIAMKDKDAAQALTLLERHAHRSHANPRLLSALAEARMNLGLSDLALRHLEERLKEAPQNTQLRFLLAKFLLQMGDGIRARAVLHDMGPLSEQAIRRRAVLRAEAELVEGAPEQAIAQLSDFGPQPAQAAAPFGLRARAHILLGNVDEAWTEHRHASALIAQNDPAGESSMKPTQSIMGQIINEFRLLATSEDLGHCAAHVDPTDAIRYYQARLAQDPRSTPLALCLMAAVHKRRVQAGSKTFGAAPLHGKGIPKALYQYWDAPEPPPQVAHLMAENRALNPDFAYRLFDDRAARAYLAEKGEMDVLRAYRLATEPAGKADLFRLALLWHEGGVYIDADDRCLKPFSQTISLDRRFIGYQEYFMSVGNNFLAVRPKEPAIRSALEEAVGAFSGPQGESLWLATGPGALTRAFACHFLDEEGQMSAGVELLTTRELRDFLSPHVMLSYKATGQHWTSRFKRSA